LVVTLLIVALIAAVLGFRGIVTTAIGIAKVIFLVVLLLFIIAAVAGTIRTVRAEPKSCRNAAGTLGSLSRCSDGGARPGRKSRACDQSTATA
jgi:uncharacterized membrane protein YtjA (UPF0391 family)